jgi:hypothetical protein
MLIQLAKELYDMHSLRLPFWVDLYIFMILCFRAIKFD